MQRTSMESTRRRAARGGRLQLACALVGLLWAAACGGEDGPASREEPLPEYTGKNEITAMVDKSGASLVLGEEVSLRIPAGALDKAEEVRVTRAAAGELAAGEPAEPRLSDLVRFEPHGLEFNKPVEIELRLKDDEVPDARVGVLRLENEKDEDWERVLDTRVLAAAAKEELEGLGDEIRMLRSGRRVQARTMRFSVYAAADLPPTGGMGGGTSGGSGTANSLGGLPWNLEDCADAGCTIDGKSFDTDGVWLYCYGATDPTGFDPDTFDFDAACVERETFDPQSSYHQFTFDGAHYYSDTPCGGSNLTVVDGGVLVGTSCYGDAAGARFAIERLATGSDGSYYRYRYDDCDGTCSPYIDVYMLEARDTSALYQGCDFTDADELPCVDGGRTVRFGPGAVGEAPADLADTLWAECEGDAAPGNPTDADILQDCALELGGDALYLDTWRFKADGTFDYLYPGDLSAWEAEVCDQPYGGADGQLRLYWCEASWGFEAVETNYEIRTIDGTDFLVLVWSESDSDVLVEFGAVPGATAPTAGEDPCADSAGFECVFE